MNQIRHNIAMSIDRGENYFVVDSKPLPVCRFARARRCKMGSKDSELTPNYGYCAAQTQTHLQIPRNQRIKRRYSYLYDFTSVSYRHKLRPKFKVWIFRLYYHWRPWIFRKGRAIRPFWECKHSTRSSISPQSEGAFRPVFRPFDRSRKRIGNVSKRLFFSCAISLCWLVIMLKTSMDFPLESYRKFRPSPCFNYSTTPKIANSHRQNTL